MIELHWSLEGTVRVRTHGSDAFRALEGCMWLAISFCGAFLSEGTDRNQTSWPTSRTAPRSPQSFTLYHLSTSHLVPQLFPCFRSTNLIIASSLLILFGLKTDFDGLVRSILILDPCLASLLSQDLASFLSHFLYSSS